MELADAALPVADLVEAPLDDVVAFFFDDEARERFGEAESAAFTITVTPSLLRLRRMLEARDIGISASSKAFLTSSASRYPWDRPRSISCWIAGSCTSGCLERVELAGDTNTSRTNVWRVGPGHP